ncbi:MAG: SusC/RagA family TonB-linked outer membrane protein [Ferruginibacter sp.]
MRKIAVLFAVLLCSTLSVFAQTTIKGKVTDSKDGSPISGATIKVKGQKTSTTSKPDGTFEIAGNVGNTLEITEVGHVSQSVKYSGGDVAISLVQDTKGLSEVVVTALGIKREKKALGYAVSTVDKKQLEARPDGDIGRLLSGKAPGVDILATSGISGSGTNIQIRGANSITGTSNPLFVIDGTPFSGATNNQTDPIYGSQTSSRFLDIDPNNIESVSVLKGLSATVLYGEQGRNGVILITTKNGAAKRPNKKTEITVSQSYFITKASSLPETQNTYGGGFSLTGGFAFFSNWGPKFTNPPAQLPHPYSVGSIAGAFPDLAGKLIDFVPHDNFGAVFKNGYVSNTGVNINAALGTTGSINANYSFMKDQGFLVTNNVKRSTFGIGINNKLSNNITVSGTINYVMNDFVSPTTAQSGASGAQNGGSGVFADLMYTPRANDLAGWPYQTPDGASAYYRPTNDIQNPLWTVHNSLTSQSTNRAYGNFVLKYNLLKNWDILYRFGYDVYSENHALKLNRGGVNSKVPKDLEYERGIYRTIDGRSRIWDHSVISQYNTSLSSDLKLDVTAGFNSNQQLYEQTGVKSSEQLVWGLFDHSNFTQHDTKTEDGLDIDYKTDYQVVGVFAQAGFGYREFLYATLGARNSWVSSVESANRSKFYPSASVSFIPTTAFEGLQGNKSINYLKLRAGYATSANFPLPYNTRAALGIATNTFVDRSGGVINTNSISNTLANPNLKPELLKELELGLEAKLFNNRVSIDFTWYNKKSSNQILTQPIDPASGYETVAQNAGNLTNKGIELGVGFTVIKSRDWTWQLDGNFTRNRSMVSNLPDYITQVQTGGLFSNIGNFAINGQPFGIIKGTYWQRENPATGGGKGSGQLLVGPDGYYISSTESVIIGDPNADFRLSGISTITYKNLELRAQLDYVKGGVIYATTVNAMTARGLAKTTDVDRAVPIILPGVKQDGTPNDYQTSLDRTFFNVYLGAHEQWLYDATTIRLREVSLSYSLPKSLLDKTPFGGLSLIVSGQNLWHKAPYMPKGSNYDPESSSGGVGKTRGFEYMTGPQSRRFGATLRVTF